MCYLFFFGWVFFGVVELFTKSIFKFDRNCTVVCPQGGSDKWGEGKRRGVRVN